MDPVQDPDDDARALAKALLQDAAHAALAVLRPDAPAPSVTRIGLTTDAAGAPMTLISSLSGHTTALETNPACALLIGAPGPKGDPLTHPRLTLHATAKLVPQDDPEHAALRARYLHTRPKAALYIDFADFRFVRFDVSDGLLNGGFGKAFRIAPADLEIEDL